VGDGFEEYPHGIEVVLIFGKSAFGTDGFAATVGLDGTVIFGANDPVIVSSGFSKSFKRNSGGSGELRLGKKSCSVS